MKILLVDDHTLFREGVVLLLERLGPDITAYEAATCAQALARLGSVIQVRLLGQFGHLSL